jgi:hypothetical protein
LEPINEIGTPGFSSENDDKTKDFFKTFHNIHKANSECSLSDLSDADEKNDNKEEKNQKIHHNETISYFLELLPIQAKKNR